MLPTTTACIEDLPPEMINELFKHLSPMNLAACSAVNKRWHAIYSNFKLHRLAVIEYDFDSNDKWYGSNRPVRETEWCNQSVFLRLVEKPLLSSLKYVALWTHKPEFDFNKLNNFQGLIHLEISTYPAGQVHLDLPRLKVLAFCFCDTRFIRFTVSIDCPQLSMLEYNEEKDVNLLNVKHPETIRKLKTNMFGAKLARFKGVELLVTDRLEVISKATLLSLPALRELHCDEIIEFIFWDEWRFNGFNGIGIIGRVKRKLCEFLDEAKKLRDNDFQFNFSGFRLANNKMLLDQIDFAMKIDKKGREKVVSEYVYMKNYHLIEPGALHFVNRVAYNRLLDSVTGEFPRCFSQKFTGITWVTTKRIEDEDHFLWFLRSLRSLKYLELVEVESSQEFLDRLPTSTHRLRSLWFSDHRFEEQLNFDFIGKFPSLKSLVASLLSLKSLYSLVKQLSKSQRGEFTVRLSEDCFMICKEKNSTKWQIYEERRSTMWRDSTWKELIFENNNLNDVMDFFELLTSELLRLRSR